MSGAVQQALAASAAYPPPAPVPVVPYHSRGRVLVLGKDATAIGAARGLCGRQPVTLLLESAAADLPAGITLHIGRLETLDGWLGAFHASWHDGNNRHQGEFDLVLDLGGTHPFPMHQPPQGYFAPASEAALQAALEDIRDGSGEFEKPKFFHYDAAACAHSRSRLDGCDRCIDICSTGAIRADGDGVFVEPHLCMGCGACASVCPSGAMRYDFPSMPYWSGKLKAMLGAWFAAGGGAPTLLLHDPREGAAVVAAAGLPDAVLPLEVFHVASIGPDWLLGALALGVGRVAVLAAGGEAPQYLAALREEMQLAEDILHGLGYGRGHCLLIEAADAAALQAMVSALPPPALTLPRAGFDWFEDKRTTLDFCLQHFVRHAPAVVPDSIPLPAGAPFGTVAVDARTCTLCFSCVAACPAQALQDGAGTPLLRFVERNCVQCGLCGNACPEQAIRLTPRLLLTAAARQPRVLHQDQPFPCVRCGKPFATTHMIGSILHKLHGHSMFTTPEARRRLQMCGECRVIDMLESGGVTESQR